MTYVQILKHIVNRAKCHILTIGQVNGTFIIALLGDPETNLHEKKAMDLKTMLESLSPASILKLADALSKRQDELEKPYGQFLEHLRMEAYVAVEKQVLLGNGRIIIKQVGSTRKPTEPLHFHHTFLTDKPIAIDEVSLDSDILWVTGGVATNTRRGVIHIKIQVADLSTDDLCALADYLESL